MRRTVAVAICLTGCEKATPTREVPVNTPPTPPIAPSPGVTLAPALPPAPRIALPPGGMPEPEEPTCGTAETCIALERTICYGTCPVYRLIVTSDGRGPGMVAFFGQLHADEGLYTSLISGAEVTAMLDAAKRAGFDALDPGVARRNCATDMPRVILTIHHGGTTRTIDHDTSCAFPGSEALTALEDEIDELARTVQWTSSGKRKVAEPAACESVHGTWTTISDFGADLASICKPGSIAFARRCGKLRTRPVDVRADPDVAALEARSCASAKTDDERYRWPYSDVCCVATPSTAPTPATPR